MPNSQTIILNSFQENGQAIQSGAIISPIGEVVLQELNLATGAINRFSLDAVATLALYEELQLLYSGRLEDASE